MTDWDEEEFNKQMKEIELLEKEGTELYQFIDNGFEWIALYQSIYPVFLKFFANMDSIGHVIDTLPNKNDSEHQFLIATLLGGVISAHEGMIHDFVSSLMNSSNYRKEENIRKIQDKDLKDLSIRKNLSWNELAKKLQGATLNHPNRVARILNALFEFNLPEDNEDEITNLIQMRNDFTHNNGTRKDGTVYNLSWEYLDRFHTTMYELVATYVKNMQPHVDKFLKRSLE
jgi:hypothetical protein